MNSNSMKMQQIDMLYNKRAMVAALILHLVILAVRFDFEPIRVEERKDAITVTIVTPEVVKKNKLIMNKSLTQVSEVLKEKPKEKVVVGTEKVIPKAKELGNPKAAVVKKVQKGDPMSKDFSKYKPGTDFQKLKRTNIGEGSAGAKAPTKVPGGGSGDTYKGADFKVKSLSNNAPLGQRFKIKNAADDMGAGSGVSGGIGSGVGKGFGDGTITGTNTGTLEKAKILTNVGSLTGATVGAIDSSKGAQGLGQKGAILLSGMPQETVVLGSMDPQEVRRILLQYIAQFRFCYQNELDKTNSEEVAGVVQLNFNIGGRGQVLNPRVTGPAQFNSNVKSCMNDVLKGIEFPAPKGGGSVEIRQPLNLYPKRL